MSIYDPSYNRFTSTGASYQMPAGKHYYAANNLFNSPNNAMNDAYIWANNNGIDVNLNVQDSVFAYSQNMYGAPVDAINNADIWSQYADLQMQELNTYAQAQALMNANNQAAAESTASSNSEWQSMMNMYMTLMQWEAMSNSSTSSETTSSSSSSSSSSTSSSGTTATEETEEEEV